MVNRSQRTLSSPNSVGSKLTLLPWLYRVLGIPNLRIQVRFRGNNLYLLCESLACPEKSAVLDLLVRSLSKVELDDLLPLTQPPIYQIIVYGRVIGEKRPDWAEVIYVSQLERYLDQTEDTAKTNSAIVLANVSLAKQGKPDAIARYLSEELSALGVAVRASVKSVALSSDDLGLPQTVNLASILSSAASLTPQSLLNRLRVVCESVYSPDASLLAETIAQKLRDLELDGFRDALVFSRVRGESRPDWVLRIDLTPPNEMLKEWARWGDIDALTRLLNRELRDQSVEVSATLLDSTLHISCQRLAQSATAKQPKLPEKSRVLAAIAPLLETIAPQGIHAAAVYGIGGDPDPTPNLSIPRSPEWVQWVNLPAAEHPALSEPTRKLAKQGDIPAIAFLLTRLLNPDLSVQLATGGIRIQVRQKEDLLHIMTDAPICPAQNQIGSKVAKFIRSLELADIQGVRVYGRRSGQNRPSWSYGVDFQTRDRLVPEATPEFAASDAYVGDLLTTEPEALIVRPDLTSDDVRAFGSRVLEKIQGVMAWTRLFTIETSSSAIVPIKSAKPVATETKVALVWGVLGVLLAVQADWALGQFVKQKAEDQPKAAISAKRNSEGTAAPTPSEELALPQLALQKTNGLGSGESFSALGFTGAGQTVISSGSENSGNTTLVASPLRPKAAVDSSRSPYPTFNARQLDEKLVLYREYVAQNGAPDVLIVGSSRAMRGIDPVVLEQSLAAQGFPGLKVFNFGVNGATAQVVDLIVRRILPFEKMPKMIVFADGSRAFNSGRVDVTYNAIAVSPGFRKLPEPPTGSATQTPLPTEALTKPLETISRTNTTISDSYKDLNDKLLEQLGDLSAVYGERDQLQSFLKTQFSTAFNRQSLDDPTGEAGIPLDGQGLIDLNGFLPIANRFNPATYYEKHPRVPGNSDADYENFDLNAQQTEALRNLAEFTRSQNIPLVVINLPLTEIYLDPFRREKEQEFQQYLMRMSSELGFTYRDLLENWKTTNDFFSDPSHLNRYGGYAVSQHIAKDPLIPWQKR